MPFNSSFLFSILSLIRCPRLLRPVTHCPLLAVFDCHVMTGPALGIVMLVSRIGLHIFTPRSSSSEWRLPRRFRRHLPPTRRCSIKQCQRPKNKEAKTLSKKKNMHQKRKEKKTSKNLIFLNNAGTPTPKKKTKQNQPTYS